MSHHIPMPPPGPPPTSIGVYPVERELGRGGMGVVYLARDPRLGRQVAIKVLPEAFTQDPVRLTRFEREARMLAAMNHKNIAMIFGLEQAQGTDGGTQQLLVLEYVPGVTLSQKIIKGAMPIDEAIRVSVQVAEGLEAAHDQGIVHRDLKPDNIRVTPDGLVKILDFGLATTARPDGFNEATTAMGSGLTVQGMVMGTPGYMSPEQARGHATDRRTDIWAFACVLFECLSGAKAFWGDSVTDALAAILDREPDYTLLPQRTPGRLRELIRRCLVKDARRRLRDVGDARIDLEDILTQPQSGWYKAADSGTPNRPRVVARLTLPLTGPAGAELSISPATRTSLAVAPDGSAIALIAGRGPTSQLYLRKIDIPECRLIPGAAGAESIFFSPDAQRMGIFEGGKLKVVSLSGGVPQTIAAAPRPQGGSWGEDGNIYFIPDWQKPLMRVPATGGTPEAVAQADLAAGELALLSPELLPGSRHVLVTVWTGSNFDQAFLTSIDLRTGQHKPLVHSGRNPRYAPTGHLVFSRGDELMAVAFDPERLEVFGQPAPVEHGVLANDMGGGAQFAFGADGTMVYAPGSLWEATAELLLADRDGGEPRVLTAEKKAYHNPVVSPDGKKLVVQISGTSEHLWLIDMARPEVPPIRLTHHADNSSPVFSPDSQRIAFRSTMSGRPELYTLRVDAPGMVPESVIGIADRVLTPAGFASQGKALIFLVTSPPPRAATEIWTVRNDDPMSAKMLAQTPAGAWHPAVTPDGRFIAYVSDESGRAEVYVQSLENPTLRRQVSSEGGSSPLWSSTGGELFFRAGDTVTAARIAIEPSLLVGRPRTMFKGTFAESTRDARNFALVGDGQQFVVLRSREDALRVTSLNIALNWFEELRRRMPVPERPSLSGSIPRTSSRAASGPSGPTMPTRLSGPGNVPPASSPPENRPGGYSSSAGTIV